MNTIYNTTIENSLSAEYISHLINKVFALLPMYEESHASLEKKESFSSYQKTLIQKINGNFHMMTYNNILVIDILSHLECLYSITNHDDYRRHILKICKMLNMLKEVVVKNGV